MALRQQEPEGRPHELVVLARNVYDIRARKLPKLSQERLAEVSDVGLNTITRLEGIAQRGELPKEPWSPSFESIRKLAIGLDVPVARFFEWPMPPYRSGKPKLTAIEGEGKTKDLGALPLLTLKTQ